MELFERKKVPVFNTSPENGESCASNSCDNDGELHKPLRNTCQTKGKPLDFHFGGKIMSVFTFLQWLFNSLVLGPVQHLGRIFYQNFRRYGSKNGRKTSLVFVINSVPSCDRLIRLYRSKYPHKLNFLGVDCEWVSAKDQRNFPVALLQIATPLSVCFLIRLCKMDGRLPQSVREILEDRNILKFGVGIQDDSKKLRASYGVNVLGCVDLRHVVHRCRVQNNTQPRNQKMSLDALAWRILGVTMDKSWRIRCSNWEAEHLAQRQIEYAMNDALVASHMFLRLVQLKGGERKKPSLENERTGENTHGCVENVTLKDQGVDVGNDKKSVQLNNTMHFHDSETNCEELEHFVKEDSADSNILKSVSEFESAPSGDCKRLAQTLSNSVSLDQQIENTGSSMSDDSASALDRNSLQSCSESEESESVGFESKCLQNLGNFGASYIGNSEEGIDELTADLSKWEFVDNTSKGYLDFAKVTNILTDSAFCQRAVSLCQGIVDLSFKQAKVKDTTGQNHSSKETHAGLKLSGKAYKTGTIRKSPLYMNCMLAAPDGSMLCTLDRKKADWYVEKGIGELTNLDPYTIQLKFEPSGRPGSEDSYYLNFKDNICVVCGSDKSYMRKNIVPHDYRKHFPSVMKDHHSHDILLMCPECHCFSNSYDDQLRKELAAKYNAPIGNAKVARLVEDQELRKVKCAAKALLYAGSKIPEKRRQELAQIIQEYYKVSDLMPELISKAATMVTLKENGNFQSHGQEVVKRVRLEGKLLEFEKMWRRHFLDTMQPEHLPPLWSVDHRHERLRQNLGQPDNS